MRGIEHGREGGHSVCCLDVAIRENLEHPPPSGPSHRFWQPTVVSLIVCVVIVQPGQSLRQSLQAAGTNTDRTHTHHHHAHTRLGTGWLVWR